MHLEINIIILLASQMAPFLFFCPQDAIEDQPGKKQQSPYAQITNVGLPEGAKPEVRSSSAWDDAMTTEEKVETKDLSDVLPNWVVSKEPFDPH